MRSTYQTNENDELMVKHRFLVDKSITDLPRIGVRFEMPKGFEQLQWFGRGPFETYPDRKTAGVVQWHRSTVQAEYVPYILPQEHGNKTDVREMHLASKRLRFSITAEAPIQASASHYPQEMLPRHITLMTSHPRIQLTFVLMQASAVSAAQAADPIRCLSIS